MGEERCGGEEEEERRNEEVHEAVLRGADDGEEGEGAGERGRGGGEEELLEDAVGHGEAWSGLVGGDGRVGEGEAPQMESWERADPRRTERRWWSSGVQGLWGLGCMSSLIRLVWLGSGG